MTGEKGEKGKTSKKGCVAALLVAVLVIGVLSLKRPDREHFIRWANSSIANTSGGSPLSQTLTFSLRTEGLDVLQCTNCGAFTIADMPMRVQTVTYLGIWGKWYRLR